MRITVGQLRALIREAVQEMNPELRPDCDTFAVFDFDETLALTDSKILVVDDDGNEIKSLTPSEYAVYMAEPGENFDFSEFDIVKGGKATPLAKAVLARHVAQCGAGAAAILTARDVAAEEPIRQFFASMNPKIAIQTIDAVGTSNPQAKVNKIIGYINSYNPKVLHFFEDSPKNLEAVRQAAKTNPVFQSPTIVLHTMKDGVYVRGEEVEYEGPSVTTAPQDSNHI